MANLTKKEKHIVEMYVRYFGTVATEEQIKSFDGVKSLSKITADIRKDADNFKIGLTPTEFLNDSFQNLFGRDANPKELKYVKTIENNKNLPIATIIKNGSRDDKAVYNTKKLVAQMVAAEGGSYELDNITQENYKSIYNVKTGLTVKTIAELEAQIVNMEDVINGKTFTLTEGADSGKDFVGTAKNDLFSANAKIVFDPSSGKKVTLDTLDSLDVLDGGKGIDTLSVVFADTATPATGVTPTLKSIENVNIKNITGVATDMSLANATGVEKVTVHNSDAATTVAGVGAATLAVSNQTVAVNFDGSTATALNLEFDTVGIAATPVTVDLATTAAAGGNKATSYNIKMNNSNITIKETQTSATTTSATVDAKGTNKLAFSAADVTSLKTLDVKGSGTVEFTDTFTALETLTVTSGTVGVIADIDATKTTVKTGAGEDIITIKTLSAANITEKAIDLGNGNDELITKAGFTVTAASATINGGAGTDIFSIATDDAIVTKLSLSTNAALFKEKVTGFEKLELTGAGNAAAVNVGNLGFNYVIATSTVTTATIIQDIANKGTVELNASALANLATINVKDAALATSTADELNLVLNATAAAGEHVGTITVANVETINISTVDLDTTDKIDAATTIELIAVDAKTITVTGDAGLVLTDTAAGNIAVTSVDASKMTGDLTFTLINDSMTVKGGAGDDVFTIGTGIDLAVISGGTGDDTYKFTGASTNKNNYTVLKEVGAGDKIDLSTGVASTSFVNTKITLSAGATESTQAYLDQAMSQLAAGQTGWFTYGGNTFITTDVGADSTTTFTDGTDFVVMITGVVDLTNSTMTTGVITIA